MDECWVYDGKRIPELGPERGRRQDQGGVQPRAAAATPRCGPAATTRRPRLEDMDRAGDPRLAVLPDASPRFCGQLFMEASDREFGLECLQIYNDWLVEEWCGAAPGRYIPLMLIPLWDPQLAAEEMERMRGQGRRPRSPSPRTRRRSACRPSTTRTATGTRSWPPRTTSRWSRACTSARRRRCPRSRPTPRSWPTSPGAPIRTSGAMLSWLFSGMFQRYPNLKIALSEGEIGWMPVLPRAGRAGARQAAALGEAGHEVHGPRHHRRRPRHARHPRATFRDHIFGCFIEDHHGIASLDEIGEDNVMCETDYPHSDSTWPDCIDVARRLDRRPRAGGAVQAPAGQRRAPLPVHAGRAAGPRRVPDRG